MNSKNAPTVVILGAGVNGSAVARELLLNGISVWIIDINDMSFGATSKSSRLIHGGLRYLEYGDFRLVSESLRERKALRNNAPHLVEPLRLYIPVKKRFSGIISAGLKFLGGSRFRLFDWILNRMGNTDRGLWLVRAGLWFYDSFASKGEFLKHQIFKVGSKEVPTVDPKQYQWLCAYSDAQVRFPERWIVSTFIDCEKLAEENELEFHLLTYHHIKIENDQVLIFDNENPTDEPVKRFSPDFLINATGAWGDLTLGDLHIPSRRLFGGTKGSHLLTSQKKLLEAMNGKGIYAESDDDRMIFILPFGQSVLIGTTDVHFDDQPENAISTEQEIEYLIELVNELFPDVLLKRDDIQMHYSGVRPLPHAVGGKTASISRDHHIEEHDSSPFPCYTLVGGKLTTARAFGELVADKIFKTISLKRTAKTLHRKYPGGDNYPKSEEDRNDQIKAIANQSGFSVKQVGAIWELAGTLTKEILSQLPQNNNASLPGIDIPVEYVIYVIQNEWVATLNDLIERRLMILYHPELKRDCLRILACMLVQENLLEKDQIESTVNHSIKHLEKHYGKTILP